eukprot:CAMPEP_0118663532 /NCGR_PEP_ID=MMETSP0785-20121206/17482_1 /TAXON_ID=91992 /ORGANISM="Bolidomonas pacifica, Strain CCMP 1866" /LENGTH=107 /DNA_ID=CAMNT_0006557283 /DNA_START=156 /DNA_END=479 /DNA_ORIENTATION=+
MSKPELPSEPTTRQWRLSPLQRECVILVKKAATLSAVGMKEEGGGSTICQSLDVEASSSLPSSPNSFIIVLARLLPSLIHSSSSAVAPLIPPWKPENNTTGPSGERE